MNAGLADVDLGESQVRPLITCPYHTASCPHHSLDQGLLVCGIQQLLTSLGNHLTPFPQIAATRVVEERVRDRIPLNGHLGYRKLMDDLMALGCTPQSVGLAVKVMIAKGELKKKNEGKLLQRTR